MTKEVSVEVKGIQYLDGYQDSTQAKGVGLYYEKDGRHFCFYEEMDYENKVTRKRALKFDKETLILVDRSDDTQMEFNVNRNCSLKYKTVAGLVDISIDTKAYKYEVLDKIIRLDVDYELTFNESTKSGHKIKIRIRPKV